MEFSGAWIKSEISCAYSFTKDKISAIRLSWKSPVFHSLTSHQPVSMVETAE